MVKYNLYEIRGGFMKKIAILGSTGSVGTQALEVIKKLKNFEVISLSAGKNVSLLENQIEEFSPKCVCVQDESDAIYLSKKFKNIEVFYGRDGLYEISKFEGQDAVLNAVSGFVGIYVSLSSIESRKTLLLANKESIVCGSKFLMNLSKEKKCKILPLDSEHSAIWQCIDGKEKFLNKIILTASGGPFFGMKKEDLKNVSVDRVINHPTWKMGNKISVNSANMMNKGMEIIEASYLFDVPVEKIDVLIHPQSIVHSMVEFVDGNILAQMSNHSMKFPIQYALTYPERENFSNGNLELNKICNLSFYSPTEDNNIILDLCKKVSYDNSTSCALNAINEEAVDAFLRGDISFLDIENIVINGIEKFVPFKISSIGDIIEADRIGRDICKNILLNYKKR